LLRGGDHTKDAVLGRFHDCLGDGLCAGGSAAMTRREVVACHDVAPSVRPQPGPAVLRDVPSQPLSATDEGGPVQRVAWSGLWAPPRRRLAERYRACPSVSGSGFCDTVGGAEPAATNPFRSRSWLVDTPIRRSYPTTNSVLSRDHARPVAPNGGQQ
jgi:hypothetical protein